MATNAGGRPWRVLVVDDEENLNWSLVTSLRRDRYEADGASSAELALVRLAERPYDCVVSDVKMPGMDGFELLQWLRRNAPGTRVIMMTAFGSPTAREQALRDGVVAYLEKPFDLRQLKELLKSLAGEVPGGAAPAEKEGYDILDVAQVLSMARRDIALRVENAGLQGMLRLLRGELVWAETGTLRGEDAFFALCVPRAGKVEPVPWEGGDERNIAQPLSRLIFQALIRRGREAAAATGESAEDAAAPSLGPSLGPSPAAAPSAPSIPIPDPIPDAPTTKMPAQTAPLTTGGALRGVLAAIAGACAAPCTVALLRMDGGVIAQYGGGLAELASGAYTHLASAAQAAARALLVADRGSLDGLRVVSAGLDLTIRRLERGGPAALCVVATERGADANHADHADRIAGIIERYEREVLAALR